MSAQGATAVPSAAMLASSWILHSFLRILYTTLCHDGTLQLFGRGKQLALQICCLAWFLWHTSRHGLSTPME
jgi:hypothetical protein